jgi:anthranilate phosphoribosyltransferase
MKRFLKIVADGRTLSSEEAEAAILSIMQGEATPAEIAGLLIGLRSRGESLDELLGCARAMRACMVPVQIDDADAVDLCGTGGDQLGTFNISTTVSFVVAGAGITVAKHGNRSVSSKSGSADVLEALGVRTALSPSAVEECIKTTGIGFLFAPTFHPAMRHVMPVRRALGVRTMFNIMGPMCNPAGVSRQLIGAFDREVARMMATILLQLGASHVITVHAEDGLDEITLTGPTTLFEVRSGMDQPLERIVDPEDLGFEKAELETLLGGSADDNAAILTDILKGKEGPQRDIVLLNSAHALLVAGQSPDIEACVAAARESIDSGAAWGSLQALAEATNRLEAV